MAQITLMDVHTFKTDRMFPYNNLLNKWNKFCISYDFVNNEAQVGFNGRVSELIKDPDTYPNYKGRFDGGLLEKETEFTFQVGRYSFDKNPFIGTIADINVWGRTMET